jgi:hypothetical protein
LFRTVVAHLTRRLHARIATAAQTRDTELLDVLVPLAAGAQRTVDGLCDGGVTL